MSTCGEGASREGCERVTCIKAVGKNDPMSEGYNEVLQEKDLLQRRMLQVHVRVLC